MRVALFPVDETGCGHFRMRWPAEAVAAETDAEVIFPPGSRQTMRAIAEGRIEVDAVVFQRPTSAILVAAIDLLRRAGVAVIVELDDDIASAHPRSTIFLAVHPSNPEHNWRHLKRACHLADMVTVTTPVLASRYGGPGKAVVLPNLVPRSLLEISTARDGRTIGWGGTLETHVEDLRVTRGGVEMAVSETGARFLQVGPPAGVRHELGLTVEPDTTGGLSFGDYHQALAQLDVGIAPLADSLFNRAKSGLKVLEYAALGVPCVASPRPEYERLASEGLCVLAADRSRAWRRECKALLMSEDLRVERGVAARERVAVAHTYEGQGWRWQEAWAEAIRRRAAVRQKVAA